MLRVTNICNVGSVGGAAMRDQVKKSIAGLKAAAEQLRDGIRRANQLPDKFPAEYVDELLAYVDEIEGDDEDSLRHATHLRDKVLQAVEIFTSDDDVGAPNLLKALHNELFVEVSRFLRVTNAAKRFPDFEARKGRAVIFSDENEDERARLLAEARAALVEATLAEGKVQNFVQQNGLINVGDINLNIEFNLIKARKAISAIVLELNSELIDLAWLSDFMRFVSRCAGAIATAVKRLDSGLRSSVMVAAVYEFLQKTLKLVSSLGSLVRRSEPPASISKSDDRSRMGVEPGQRYRPTQPDGHPVSPFELAWEVEALVRPKTGPEPDVWHARLVSVVGSRRGDDTKMIGVSVLRDSRFYQQLLPTKPEGGS